MTEQQNLIIRPLDGQHKRAAFTCGTPSLDQYIQKQAGQDIKRRVSRVFIASTQQLPNEIVGYYTLSSMSIELSHLPPEITKKLPRYPVPAALIGRLAVSQNAQGQGVGKMLLVDAIKRTMAVSQDIAIYSMVVDSIDQNAQAFYEKFGFTQLNTSSNRLFLPLQTI